MRRLALLLLLTAMALPASAAKRVSVAQLDQILGASLGKSDEALAQQISELELTERLSAAYLERLKGEFQGEKTQQALVMLADQSAFLDPPASEIPAKPAPDVAEQRRIMGLVVGYVSKTIPQLPNFFASRSTTRFEDTPQILGTDNYIVPYRPLHWVGDSNATVLYRDGREVVDSGTGKEVKHVMAQGLTTWGVFGPILSTVLLDAAHSKLIWGHWEQGTAGVEAVFAFEVPKEKSNYEVNYCCVALQAATAVANVYPFRRIVGYSGEMAVDPATGTILRIAVEADLKPTDPVARADIEVEYGPVEIGGKTYYCPARSISSTVAQSVQVDPVYHYALANQIQPLKKMLNGVAFDRYHVFRGDMRVLTAAEAELAAASALPAKPGAENTPESAPPESAASPFAPAQPSSAANESAATPPKAASAGASETAATANSAPSEAPAPTPAPEPPTAELSVAPATALPVLPADAKPSAEPSGFTLRTTARLVDVSVVVVDKKGRPMTDLKPGDFEVYDNGRKQQIRFFSPAGSAAEPPPATQPAGLPEQFSNHAPRQAAASLSAGKPESDSTILLIDASNLAWGDLSYARQELLSFLKAVPAGEPVGLYVLKSHGFQILEEPTLDHVQLAAVLAKWMPSAQDLEQAQEEEQRNRRQMEYVHTAADLQFVNGNPTIATSAAEESADPQLLEMGSDPTRVALIFLAAIARPLAAIAGHKTLVWIASDNVLADWSSQAAARQDQGSHFNDSVALRAQEALNEAHVSLYPLDASRLEAGGVGANLESGNVQLAPAMTASSQAQMQAIPGSDRQEVQEALRKSTRDINPGRATAQMQQDTHPIQGIYREIAEATGGRAFRRSGEIAAELEGAIADGRAAYLLSFTPDAPADDKYHVLTVKLAGKRGAVERYRAGYFAATEPASLKDRFKQAIWQPADTSEIGIDAKLTKGANGPALDLNLAGTDLDLAEQGGRWMDKLDIFLVRRDDSALHAVVTGQTLGLRLTPATYQKVLRDGLPFEEPIGAKPGSGSIRTIVVDENTGRIGSITISATVLP